MTPARLIALVAVALASAAVAAAPAPAGAAVPVPAGAPAPDGARALGPLCRHDTPAFRLWWTDAPAAPGAVDGADGSCATLPPVVGELAGAAEAARARARAMGFPAMTGDAAPPALRSPRLLRALLRTPPAPRARLLGALRRADRGRFLAGLSAAARNRVLRGLPRGTRGRLLAEARRARRGSPRDFVGGDRRVDVVIDATGVTRQVQPGQPGLAPCRARIEGRRRAFVAAWAVVLAERGAPAPREVLAHELFHVVQCAGGSGPGTPVLVREGTAEWFAALAEPAAFPGPVGPGGSSVGAGNARAVTFCNGFDPAGPGTAPYASWPVWEALDPGAPGGTVARMLRAFPGRAATAPSPAAVVARVGGARWAEALRVAVREVCGNRRSPTGAVALAAEVRDFLGATRTPARPGQPASVTIAAGGVATAGAVWGALPATAVTVSLRSGQVPPEALAAAAVVTTVAGPLPVQVRGGAAVVDVPAEALGERYVPVTVANPAPAGAVTVTVEVAPVP